MEKDGGGGSTLSGGGCKVGQGGLPWQIGTVDMMGQCGGEEDQLEGRVGHGSEATELYHQSYIRCPSNTS